MTTDGRPGTRATYVDRRQPVVWPVQRLGRARARVRCSALSHGLRALEGREAVLVHKVPLVNRWHGYWLPKGLRLEEKELGDATGGRCEMLDRLLPCRSHGFTVWTHSGSARCRANRTRGASFVYLYEVHGSPPHAGGGSPRARVRVHHRVRTSSLVPRPSTQHTQYQHGAQPG